MDWTQALVVGGMFAANIITVITLFIHSDSKMHANQKETSDLIRAIHDEMKDFHGRLCAIEERNRK